MAISLPRFYPILDLSLRAGRTLEELTGPLVEAGARWIQLRGKSVTSEEFLDCAKRLLEILPDGLKCIVNDRADIVQLAGAAGVHLGQDDLPPAEARRLLGPEAIVGFSTHGEEQVRAAAGEKAAPVDYLAFGPVFPTATKAGADEVAGLEGLRKARAIYPGPLVAIGGITAENAAQVVENGADSVAVISGWMDAADLPARLGEFRRALGRLD